MFTLLNAVGFLLLKFRPAASFNALHIIFDGETAKGQQPEN
jgi:hypothetical protein